MNLHIVPPAPTTITEQIDEHTYREHLQYKDKKHKNINELESTGHNVRTLLRYHYKNAFRWNAVTLKIEQQDSVFTQFLHKNSGIDHIVSVVQDFFSAKHEINIGREAIGFRLIEIAQENSFDPIQDWLNSLEWDNERRLNSWLLKYCDAESDDDPNYIEVVGRKWFLSVVARAFHPGCKADDVLVAEGLQGAHKSTLFSILGGPWFAEGIGALGDKDSKMLIASALIVELPDMAPFSKTEKNTMKAFFTLKEDKYRPPYGKEIIAVKRRAVFAATTNDEDYLSDPTGNRRFRPVQLKKIDRAALIRDRDQLFAEAVVLWRESKSCADCKGLPVVIPGEHPRCEKHSWWFSPLEEKIAAKHAKWREETDSWTVKVKEFIHNTKGKLITTSNILTEALNFQFKDITRREEMRVASIMKRENYHRPRRGTDSVWVKNEDRSAHASEIKSPLSSSIPPSPSPPSSSPPPPPPPPPPPLIQP